MPDPRDFLPMLPWEGPPVPEYLLKIYPFLRSSPFDIWKRFWPFSELPPIGEGIYPEIAEEFYEMNRLPISRVVKQQQWSEKVIKLRDDMLITPDEEVKLLQWSYKFNHDW